jgi:hypothetical protein
MRDNNKNEKDKNYTENLKTLLAGVFICFAILSPYILDWIGVF